VCDNELGSDNLSLDEIVNSTIEWASSPSSFYPETTSLTSPSIKSSPSLELKTFSKYLEYTYLGEQETLPVIITPDLTDRQEEDLMMILRKHKKAIGWTMTDIKELSQSIVHHHIHLNEEAKPKRDPQCKLNPIM